MLFLSILSSIENFFKTSDATLFGAVFLLISSALILFLLKYFEKK